METTLFPSVAANATGIGTVAWSNPANVQGDTNTEASVAPPSNGAITNWLRTTGFGFQLPSDAKTIRVRVNLERRGSNNNRFRTEDVRLVVGGNAVGDNKSTSDSWNALATVTYEWTEAECVALGLTPAVVNSAGFGVQVAGVRSAAQTVTAFARRISVAATFLRRIPLMSVDDRLGSLTLGCLLDPADLLTHRMMLRGQTQLRSGGLWVNDGSFFQAQVEGTLDEERDVQSRGWLFTIGEEGELIPPFSVQVF